jgi:hypothetical protein
MAIFVICFASILAVESGAINASDRAKTMNIVQMLAKNQMIEEEYKIEGKTFDEVKKEESGAFEAPYTDYKWKAEVKEVEFPNLNFQGAMNKSGGGESAAAKPAASTAGADANNTDMSDQVTKLVSQYLTKAVRQLTVTITWPKGGGTMNYTVTTYWVDLNHEFQLSQ